MTKTARLALLATLLAAGCSEPPPAPKEEPKPEPAKVQPKPAAPTAPVSSVPALTEGQKQALEAAFVEARGYAKQAAELKSKGDAIEKAQGRQAANDTLAEAKKLYNKACGLASEWLDGDLASKVTDAQVKEYLNGYATEVGRWQKAISDIGKVHKD